MDHKPKVSIVTPTYNQAELLKGCIRSVLNQSFDDWELIIVDNFSEDHTSEVVESYKDSRIRYFKNRNNGVIANSRNFAINGAEGQWLAFLDSDDTWEPRKLEKCLQNLEEHGVSAVCHGENWLYENGDIKPVVYGDGLFSDFLKLYTSGNIISTSAVVVLKEEVVKAGGFAEEKEFITSEDYHLWLKLLKQGVEFVFIPEILGTYLIHNMGNSHNIDRNTNAVLRVIDALGLDFGVEPQLTRKAKAITFLGAARLHAERGSILSCVKFIKESISSYPSSLNNLLRSLYYLSLALFRKLQIT